MKNYSEQYSKELESLRLRILNRVKNLAVAILDEDEENILDGKIQFENGYFYNSESVIYAINRDEAYVDNNRDGYQVSLKYLTADTLISILKEIE